MCWQRHWKYWKDEHPPAMHSAMGWCKPGYINQMLNWPHTGFKALRAGRRAEKKQK